MSQKAAIPFPKEAIDSQLRPNLYITITGLTPDSIVILIRAVRLLSYLVCTWQEMPQIVKKYNLKYQNPVFPAKS
jgi:hypothetical protein